MFDPFELAREFFEGLTAIDEAIVAWAALERCRDVTVRSPPVSEELSGLPSHPEAVADRNARGV